MVTASGKAPVTVYSFNRHWSEPVASCAMDMENKARPLLLEAHSVFGKQMASSASSKYMLGSYREVNEVLWKQRRQAEVCSRK